MHWSAHHKNYMHKNTILNHSILSHANWTAPSLYFIGTQEKVSMAPKWNRERRILFFVVLLSIKAVPRVADTYFSFFIQMFNIYLISVPILNLQMKLSLILLIFSLVECKMFYAKNTSKKQYKRN